jgi:hypothetical protein
MRNVLHMDLKVRERRGERREGRGKGVGKGK